MLETRFVVQRRLSQWGHHLQIKPDTEGQLLSGDLSCSRVISSVLGPADIKT